MRFSFHALALAAAATACGAPYRHPAPTTGGIAGLARDHDSGDPVSKAEIHIRADGDMHGVPLTTNGQGIYGVDGLRPGRYSLEAVFAGQPVDVEHIDVRAGEVAVVDVTFTLGRPDPIRVDYGDAKQAEIDHYKPKNLANAISVIEGTVNDAGTKERIAGAVVTAIHDPGIDTQQTISDAQGRYRFDGVLPGTYSVSTYYSVSGERQIEVRRSNIKVVGAEAVVVPLWIEANR
ncbi:MAG TPA: carboxypeptidase-like regulatory domain-containing protein [Kofleriaceae bacterium]